jgi:hypothetical protein
VASGILGNLTYIVARADLDVPDLHRSSPLENFAVWSGQLAVMASHCGAQDELVNKSVDLSRQYIAKQAKDERSKSKAEADLSEVMLQAELENWGDKEKCVEILPLRQLLRQPRLALAELTGSRRKTRRLRVVDLASPCAPVSGRALRHSRRRRLRLPLREL